MPEVERCTRLRCCLALLLATLSTLTQANGLRTGDTAPNWILMDKQGETVSLYQEADRGRTTVMIFCASWCDRCQELLPQLQAMNRAQDPTSPSASFYVMNVWEDGDPVAFVQDKAPSLPLVLRAEHVAKRFDVEVTPGVVVVGPDRKIIYQREPGTEMPQVAAQLEDILSRAGSSSPAKAATPR